MMFETLKAMFRINGKLSGNESEEGLFSLDEKTRQELHEQAEKHGGLLKCCGKPRNVTISLQNKDGSTTEDYIKKVIAEHKEKKETPTNEDQKSDYKFGESDHIDRVLNMLVEMMNPGIVKKPESTIGKSFGMLMNQPITEGNNMAFNNGQNQTINESQIELVIAHITNAEEWFSSGAGKDASVASNAFDHGKASLGHALDVLEQMKKSINAPIIKEFPILNARMTK